MSKTGGTIYAIGIEGMSLVKIGSTRTSVAERLRTLQTGQPFVLQLVATVAVPTHLRQVEHIVHQLLAKDRQHGEWFEGTIDDAALVSLVVRAIAALQEEATIQGEPKPLLSRVFGKTMKKARIDKDLTQAALQTITGIDFRHLSAIERGDIDSRWSTVLKLAHALDLNLDGVASDTMREQQEVASGSR